jgi:calcineurin-like phosphoesterase family protein
MSFTKKFYTADLHFGHAAIRQHCPATRNYAIVEEMDIAIMCAINERVGKNDILYVIGDFAVCSDAEYVRHCFNMLNGRKRLILGNHDIDRKGRVRKDIANLSWDRPPTHALETTDEGCHVYLHHYACRVWPRRHHGSYHLYGHSHGTLPSLGRSRDVGIDCTDTAFAPLTIREIKETLDA